MMLKENKFTAQRLNGMLMSIERVLFKSSWIQWKKNKKIITGYKNSSATPTKDHKTTSATKSPKSVGMPIEIDREIKDNKTIHSGIICDIKEKNWLTVKQTIEFVKYDRKLRRNIVAEERSMKGILMTSECIFPIFGFFSMPHDHTHSHH